MADDFEAHFARLGLSALLADASCDATFASGEHDNTVGSAPRTELTALDAQTAGTLPQLSLATPDAARAPGDGDAELVVVQVLGEGGMGRVLLARQHSLGRDVAVKVLKPGPPNPGAADALVEEARTTGSLEHPAVVPVYALARDARGAPALVMKRVDGVSWRTLLQDPFHPGWERIAQGRDRLEANLEVLIQVCSAIAHAHRRGVIHRDLKPANILIGELGEVYVADWGIAIQKAGLKSGPPRLVGTPAYLAPEMVTGDASRTDERTDVYLLGGVLHEVLTGSPTHHGGTIHDVLERAFAPAPPVFPAELSVELAQICRRALAASPGDRFQSALALRDALRLFLEHRGSIHLAAAASVRLARLEAMARSPLADEEVRSWYSDISECRFGFTQALEADPQSQAARAGLERCLEIAATRELERGGLGAARAFFAEMKSPSAALEAALNALEAKTAEQALREGKLKQLAHQLDPSVSVTQRNQLIVLLSITIGVVVLAFGLITPLRESLTAVFGRWMRMVPMGVVCVVFFVSLGIGRRALLTTRINRQLMAVIGVGLVLMEVGRVQFILLDLPLRVSLMHDALQMAGLMGLCVFFLHWGFALPAVIFVLGGVGVGLVPPELAVPVFSSFTAVGVLSCVPMSRLWHKALAREGLTSGSNR